jgi:acylglycerol lipase
VHTVDHPGHGRSPGTRGDIRSMAVTVGGVAALVREAADAAPGLPVFVYGHSLGGLIALQYLTGRPDARVRGAVISAPALASGAAAGPVQRLLAPLVARVLPELGVLRLDPDAVSRDPAVVAAYLGDPLNHTGKVRARTGHEMVVAGDAMPGRLARLTVPVLVLHGGADRLVPPSASEVVTERAGSADVTRTVYAGLYHEPHNEPEREQVLDDVVAWLDAHRR